MSDRDHMLCRKRELHRRIARSRRKIDRRLRGVKDDSRQLLSWRTYVTRCPGWAILAALGAGVAASGGLRPSRVSRWLSRALVRHAFGGIQRRVWDDFKNILS